MEKIRKYLYLKEKNSYSELDTIFEMYLNGEIEKILSSYDGIGIYPSFTKKEKSIQIVYNFHNIYVTIDFFEDKYNLVIYNAGLNVNELEKLFVDYEYPQNFNLKLLIDEIDIKIKTHSKLKDMTLSKKNKKIYSIISWISLSLPIIICGSIGLYCAITGESVKGNALFGIFFIAIPLILWFVFGIKSKR